MKVMHGKFITSISGKVYPDEWIILGLLPLDKSSYIQYTLSFLSFSEFDFFFESGLHRPFLMQGFSFRKR